MSHKIPVPDPHNLGIRCLVNGETVQSSNTDQMIFKTEKLVAWVSKYDNALHLFRSWWQSGSHCTFQLQTYFHLTFTFSCFSFSSWEGRVSIKEIMQIKWYLKWIYIKGHCASKWPTFMKDSKIKLHASTKSHLAPLALKHQLECLDWVRDVWTGVFSSLAWLLVNACVVLLYGGQWCLSQYLCIH